MYSALLDYYAVSDLLRAEILKLLGEKNYFGIIAACESAGLDCKSCEAIGKLVTLYGSPKSVRAELCGFAVNDGLKKEIDRFTDVLDRLEEEGLILDRSDSDSPLPIPP